MPRSNRRKRIRKSPEVSYSNLEQRLVLIEWLNQRLGYNSNSELLEDVKPADEGFDGDGRSHIYTRLASRESQLQEVSLSDLKRYDEHIRTHLSHMNHSRVQPITLRYFQYLAALYTEIFLDWRFNRTNALLRSLNDLVSYRNGRRRSSDPREIEFTELDLNKLAFWMATGSGKTLIMHLNYLQFMHYNNTPLDNILLITPNEGLSEQHLSEFQTSNIPATRFDLNENEMSMLQQNIINITEITKLVEEKRGGGVSVPVEVFEGNNLIFVDEGHKGSGGEVWRNLRDLLGETGFTFEYSATFGQALTASGNDDLKAEYGKAIVFDYSYRYFYNDGYGKDYHILNLQGETSEDQTDMLLLANLLSFYEQQLLFTNHKEDFRQYNLEQPLQVFIGRSVNAVHRENRRDTSDVLKVLSFLNRFSSNPSRWVQSSIRDLMNGNSGLRDLSGKDIFADKFEYLHSRPTGTDQIYRDILSKVMHSESGGALHLCDIRGSDGELGIKIGSAEEYFGLIYIGDTTRFKNLVASEEPGVVIEDDSFSDSLFEGINDPSANVEILIGSRKFMEGWNSWRVSNMGLLNIGRNEGPQIIQLFGRGVRLRGRGMSLKRSSALPGGHPDRIKLLETLNIFGVRANYMTQFRDYLEREGAYIDGLVDIPLFIRPARELLDEGLVIPRVDDGRDFSAETVVTLQAESGIRPVSVDMSGVVSILDSDDASRGRDTANFGNERSIPTQSLELVDWGNIYLDLVRHKEEKGLDNLAIHPNTLKSILANETLVYRLMADDDLINPRSRSDLDRLQKAVVNILRKYVDKLYSRKREQWASKHMTYKTLDESHSNFKFNGLQDGDDGRYVVSVDGANQSFISEIEELIANCRELYEKETGKLERIYFDRHLYQPLLLESSNIVKMTPPGLNEGEKRFVKDLKAYWINHQHNKLADTKIFLLRNQSRGQGLGFFEDGGFYPDFILWIVTSDKQRIVFVEPHGMINSVAYQHDDKARLHEKLPELASGIGKRSGLYNVCLDSFIISTTPYEELHRRYGEDSWDMEQFTDAHILFPARNADYDYLDKIIECHPVHNC